MARISNSYRGGHGARPHTFKADEVKCPACMNCSAIVGCDYCDDEGMVSSSRAKIIEKMIGVEDSPQVGCDHEWTLDSEMVEQGRSPAHPAGASPPDYKQIKVCKKCGAEAPECSS